MDAYMINKELDGLYHDLETAYNNDEETVCLIFNTDSKQEIIRLITVEIDSLEKKLKEIEMTCEDSGMDYNAICEVQGLSR